MINVKARRLIEELIPEYAAVYGKEPDLLFGSSKMTDAQMAASLRLMIRDNVSLISAYGTLFASSGQPSAEDRLILAEYKELLEDR